MIPEPEVQMNKAQELGHYKGKIPLESTTSSGCINSFSLKAGVEVSKLPPMSSWPHGAFLAIADLKHFFQLQQPVALGFTSKLTNQSAEVKSWYKSFTKEILSWWDTTRNKSNRRLNQNNKLMNRPCLILHNEAEGKQSSTSMAAGEDKFLALQFTSWLAWLQLQSVSHKAKWMWSEQKAFSYCSHRSWHCLERTKKCPTPHFFPRQMGLLAVWSTPSDKSHLQRPRAVHTW